MLKPLPPKYPIEAYVIFLIARIFHVLVLEPFKWALVIMKSLLMMFFMTRHNKNSEGSFTAVKILSHFQNIQQRLSRRIQFLTETS